MYKKKYFIVFFLLFLFIFYQLPISYVDGTDTSIDKIDQPDINTLDWWTYKAEINTDRVGINITVQVTVEGKETIKINGKSFEVWNISYIGPYFNNNQYYNISDFSFVKDVQIINDEAKSIGITSSDYSLTFTDPVSFWPLELGKELSFKTDAKWLYKLQNEIPITDVEFNYICSDEMVTVRTEIGEFECYEVIFNFNHSYSQHKKSYYYTPELQWFVKYRQETLEREETINFILKDYKGFDKGADEKDEEEQDYSTIFLIGILIFLLLVLSIIIIKFLMFKKREQK